MCQRPKTAFCLLFLVHFLVASSEFGFIRFLHKVLVPLTFFTVGQSVLQIERAVGKDLVAVGTCKALRMEVCGHSLQAVLQKEKFIRTAIWRFYCLLGSFRKGEILQKN